ncbi:Uncharacterized protein TPAR_02036 [Tolypocladium paradoxum]|uniref:Rieske domain-containing protein n=1 Tax=Tolypocladium paradoxum TaxID=94208 RepID=A0A2S4L5P5_9HYPO|nr:Uncharacterized protein TPAR_02036 [Tolypocladium paradoxum]
MNIFIQNPWTDAAWHFPGFASSFPDLGLDNNGSRIALRCKAFTIPSPMALIMSPSHIDLRGDLKDQVFFFKYKNNFYAINHDTTARTDTFIPSMPSLSFPLSQGSLSDIEDFGIVLSAGPTCPKHGRSFDIFSGRSDRGNYKPKMWEVQLRDPATTGEASETTDKEVWVRRKQRIG